MVLTRHEFCVYIYIYIYICKHRMEKPAANWTTYSYIAVTAMKNRLIRHCRQIHGTFYRLRHYGRIMKRTL